MAAPPTRASPSGFAALPADLLVLVFARLPLRPRLKVIALVCHRWRSAAYLTVTSIPAPLYYDGPFERYPNLTECTFSGPQGVPSSWTAEQRARLRSVRFELPTKRAVLREANLSSLTSLRAYLLEEHVPQMTDLVAASAASLTHLDLHEKSKGHVRRPTALPPMPASLPALRSLDLGFSPAEDGALLRFASAFSQLTHLGIRSVVPDCYSHSFPALRSVSLWSLDASDARWVTSLPSLTTLEANWFQPLSEMEHAVSTVLRSASLIWSEPPEKLDALCKCTSLRHLLVWPGKLPGLRHLAPLGGSLTSMAVTLNTGDFDDAHLLLAPFTSLTRLTISPGGRPHLLTEWRLPHLRELRSTAQPLTWVTLALRTFPTLECLSLESVSGKQADVAPFEEAARAADRRGMERIDLGRHGHLRLCTLQQSLTWLQLHTIEG